ncbi:hypothetical protein KCU65_g3609, partial [Aureobasidium melanogenum]
MAPLGYLPSILTHKDHQYFVQASQLNALDHELAVDEYDNIDNIYFFTEYTNPFLRDDRHTGTYFIRQSNTCPMPFDLVREVKNNDGTITLKISPVTFICEGTAQSRPNAGNATTAAPLEPLEETEEEADEEAEVRATAEAIFEEAEFLLPDELIDSLVVEEIGNLDAEPEEVKLALTVPPINPVAGSSLADANVELERNVEAVVATDTE